jgi:hypothetical protein
MLLHFSPPELLENLVMFTGELDYFQLSVEQEIGAPVVLLVIIAFVEIFLFVFREKRRPFAVAAQCADRKYLLNIGNWWGLVFVLSIP